LPRIECLPIQLNQVFMNLLVNAVQAIGERPGRITIRTGSTDDGVWLEFIDNGCGIPQNIRRKIFDPFFTTRPVGKGAGLGLSLSYGIIQSHNGSIELESEVGQGSCFRVRLPTRQTRHSDSSER
jgi:two-component system, NtrC family, sensor kinase